MPHRFVPHPQHIRNVILFFFLSGLKPPESERRLVEVYHSHAPSVVTVRKWYARFENYDFSLADQDRSGRPPTLDLDRLRDDIEADPYQTVRGLADTFGVDYSTIDRGLHSLGKKPKLGRWVPHELSDYDMDRRVDMSLTLLTLHRTTNWLDLVVTGDEKWVHYDNSERVHQWVDADQKPAPVPKPDIHGKKIMLCIWWSVKGVEYWELLPEGQTITAQVYITQLQRLRAHLLKTRGKDARIYFQHDNARPHTARATKAELATYGWTVLPHPPYSPDLAPSDYHLFSALYHFLRMQSFSDRAQVETVLRNFFNNQPKEFYEGGIHKLPELWRKTIDAKGDYF